MECVCVFRRAFQSSAATAALASLNTTTGERFTWYSHSANTQTGETYSYSCTTLSSYSLPPSSSSSFSLFQHRRSTTLPYYYHHSILLFPQSCQPVVRQLSVVQCLAFLLFLVFSFWDKNKSLSCGRSASHQHYYHHSHFFHPRLTNCCCHHLRPNIEHVMSCSTSVVLLLLPLPTRTRTTTTTESATTTTATLSGSGINQSECEV